MEQLCINGTEMALEPLTLDHPSAHCALCECGTESVAFRYIQQLDQALGGIVDCRTLSKLMADQYKKYFFDPLQARGVEHLINIDENCFYEHFTRHHIDPRRTLRDDVLKLQKMQDSMLVMNAADSSADMPASRNYVALCKIKMETLESYRKAIAHNCALPTVPDLFNA